MNLHVNPYHYAGSYSTPAHLSSPAIRQEKPIKVADWILTPEMAEFLKAIESAQTMSCGKYTFNNSQMAALRLAAGVLLDQKTSMQLSVGTQSYSRNLFDVGMGYLGMVVGAARGGRLSTCVVDGKEYTVPTTSSLDTEIGSEKLQEEAREFSKSLNRGYGQTGARI